jgi:hypothetical protein
MLTLKDKLHPFRTMRKLVQLCEAQTELIAHMKTTIELTRQVGEAQTHLVETKARLASTIARQAEPTPQCRMVDLSEIERLINEWVANTSIDTVMAIFEGDDDHDYSPEFAEQLRQSAGAYLCYLWLQAAKKRAAAQVVISAA